VRGLVSTNVVVLLWSVAAAAVVSAGSKADVEGTWLGTMKIPSGPELRLVVDIEARVNESLAAQRPSVAFIAMMAGPGIPAADILYYRDGAEVQAEGASDGKVAMTRCWWQQRYGVVNVEKDNEVAATKIRALYADLAQADKELLGWSEGRLNGEIGRVTSTRYRYFLTLDPAPYLKQVKCPVLALNSAKDVQVPCRDNLQGTKATLEAAGNDDCTTRERVGLNHMFQTAETVAPAALQTVTDWLLERTGR